MRSIEKFLDKQLYPDCQKRWDDTLFREQILNCICPRHVVLDVGAGAGIIPQMNFKGRVAESAELTLIQASSITQCSMRDASAMLPRSRTPTLLLTLHSPTTP